MADVNPVGPIYAADDEIITSSGYTIAYLPDLHNDELQQVEKPPVYYWLPNTVRLARKNGDQGDYKFRMIHFVGIRGEDTHVGVEGNQEVSGSLVGFSTTTSASACRCSALTAPSAPRRATRWWPLRSGIGHIRRQPLVDRVLQKIIRTR
jgi:hypothetical protein